MSEVEDSEFKLQVTFPENEELELRRRLVHDGDDDEDEDSDNMTSSYR